MPPMEPLHLKHVLQTVGVLEAVVLRSFGPQGGQVLFTRDTGQAMLSRSGTRILTALRLEHPLARMVVNCVWKNSSVTGDGSKTFILLLASLLRMIHTMACKEPHLSHTYNSRDAAEAATARQLSHQLLAFASEDLDALIALGVAPYGFCVAWKEHTAKTQSPQRVNNRCVQKLLASFFHTRLGPSHCDFTSNLTCELLGNLRFKNDLLSFALQFVSDNLPALHTPVSGFAIGCSRLIEGQVIHRDFAMFCPQSDQQPVKAVVFTEHLQPKLLGSGDVLKVGRGGPGTVEKSIVEFSTWAEKALVCVFAKLRSLGISLLLSAVKQSAVVLALAAQVEMCVVECIGEDELALFAHMSGTTPVSDCWAIEPVNVAHLTFCRPILLGVHRYVHVSFHDFEDRVMVKPCSLVLCGPGEGQTDQYASALQDAIRMLLTTCKPMDRTSTAASKSTLHPDKNTPTYIVACSDKTTCASSNAHHCQHCVLEPGCVIPAGGTFEFLLNHALLKHPRSRSVSRLLADALLSVPRMIYSQSPRQFLVTQTRILSLIPNHSDTFSLPHGQESNASLMQGCGRSDVPLEHGQLNMHCRRPGGSLGSSILDLGLESIFCKHQLLLAVLQCASSVLRVDTMLYTHAALNTQSRRTVNISWKGSEDEAED